MGVNLLRDIESLRSLSDIYSGSNLSRLIKNEDFSFFKNRIDKHANILFEENKKYSFNSFLSLLYQKMLSEYRNEYIYKNTITNEILIKEYKLKDTILLNEFRIGKSIADLILINGDTKLYEIKTDLDNLNRLDGQLNEYKKAIDYIYIVTNKKYVGTLSDFYSESNYGLIEFEENGNLVIHKKAILDESGFDHVTLFKLLRKNEYLNIIQNYFGYLPEVPNTKIFTTCLNLVTKIEICYFKKLVFKEIKGRTIQFPNFILDPRTPFELKFACYCLDLTPTQYHNLFTVLENKI